MPYLITIRHGQSEANRDGIIAGVLDSPLTEQGRAQARSIASKIAHIPLHVAHASTLVRTQQTLAEVLNELGSDLSPSYHEDIRERHWGRLEGAYADNRDNSFTEEENAAWRTWTGRPPEGEANDEVATRMIKHFNNELLPLLKEGKNVVIVSHGGALRVMHKELEDVPEEDMYSLSLSNCDAKVYEFDEDGKIVSIEILNP